jgi:hypothetical protein
MNVLEKVRINLILTFGTFGYKSKEITSKKEHYYSKYMSSFTLLDLASRAKNPDFYDKSRDMETALSWNAVQWTLKDMWRWELSKYITSIRLTDKNIVITTGKPIANAEIKIYSEQILSRLNTSLGQIKIFPREKVIFK